MRTPTTPAGLAMYDDLDPLEAILSAWTIPGPHPDHHSQARAVVWAAMPLLARALDRAEREVSLPLRYIDGGSDPVGSA